MRQSGTQKEKVDVFLPCCHLRQLQVSCILFSGNISLSL